MSIFIFCIKCKTFTKYSLGEQRYIDHLTPEGDRCSCDPIVSFRFSKIDDQLRFAGIQSEGAPRGTYCPRCGVRFAESITPTIPGHMFGNFECGAGGMTISSERCELTEDAVEVLKQSRRFTNAIVETWSCLNEIDVIERRVGGSTPWRISCPACGRETVFSRRDRGISEHTERRSGNKCEAPSRIYRGGEFYMTSKAGDDAITASFSGFGVRATSKYTFDQSVSIRPILSGLPETKRRR